MKKLKKRLKAIAVFLSGLILLQSCSSYKTPVTLEQAVQNEKAVKVTTVDEDSQEYKYIMYSDGQFYGVKENPGDDVKFPISTDEVKTVLMKKGLPWWAWTLIIVGGIFVIGLIICATGGCGGLGGGLDWGGSYAELK
ncbi:hypothetical protein ACT6NV_04985 [Robiginitalea sp. IMCC44478]|uniref:hypothetical protein n=1 Tax=Robiginitalea sp. IMCC44478 TaxID=3459122 RepID=UPI004041BA01